MLIFLFIASVFCCCCGCRQFVFVSISSLATCTMSFHYISVFISDNFDFEKTENKTVQQHHFRLDFFNVTPFIFRRNFWINDKCLNRFMRTICNFPTQKKCQSKFMSDLLLLWLLLPSLLLLLFCSYNKRRKTKSNWITIWGEKSMYLLNDLFSEKNNTLLFKLWIWWNFIEIFGQYKNNWVIRKWKIHNEFLSIWLEIQFNKCVEDKISSRKWVAHGNVNLNWSMFLFLSNFRFGLLYTGF